MDWDTFLINVVYAMFIIGFWEFANWLRSKFKRKPWQYTIKQMNPAPIAEGLREIARKMDSGEYKWKSGGIRVDRLQDQSLLILSNLIIEPYPGQMPQPPKGM